MKNQLLILLLLWGLVKGFGQTTDYVGFWPLDGDAIDQSSNSLDGTINGAISSMGHDDLPNTSLYFDGTDDYVVIPNSSLLQFGTGSFSISFWMKPDVNTNVRLIDHRGAGAAGSYPGYLIKLYTDGSNWYFYSAGIDDASGNFKGCQGAGSSYPCNQWYHVVMCYEEDAELRFYVDGILDATISTGSYGSINNSLPTGFGASVSSLGSYSPPSTVSQFYKGGLDDVYMFDREISETEISWLSEKLTIGFEYDDAGNRTDRTIHLNLAAAKGARTPVIHSEEIFEDSLGIARIDLYPNPTKGEIRLEIIQQEEIRNASVNVYSSSGRIVYSRKLYNLQEQIDLSNQTDGLYLIVVTINDTQEVWKVLKE